MFKMGDILYLSIVVIVKKTRKPLKWMSALAKLNLLTSLDTIRVSCKLITS